MLMYLSKKYGSSSSPSKFQTVIHGEGLFHYCESQQTIIPVSTLVPNESKPKDLSRNLFLPYSFKKRSIDRKLNSIILQRKCISRPKVQARMNKERERQRQRSIQGLSKEITFPQITNKRLSVSKTLIPKEYKSVNSNHSNLPEDPRTLGVEEKSRNCEHSKCSRREKHNKNKLIERTLGKRRSEGDIMLTKHGWSDGKHDNDPFAVTRFFN